LSEDGSASGFDYFNNRRADIESLLPGTFKRVLEVGCGTGATLRWLGSLHEGVETVGIEINPEVRPILEGNVGRAITAPALPCPEGLGTFDLILFLDVLEHLADPDAAVQAYVPLLSPGGSLIVSLPNVAHFSVSGPLFFKGQFEYEEAGILDRTHLRFFVESSALGLMNRNGLKVVDGLCRGPHTGKTRLLDRLSLGLMRRVLTRQYVFRAEWGAAAQSSFRWRA